MHSKCLVETTETQHFKHGDDYFRLDRLAKTTLVDAKRKSGIVSTVLWVLPSPPKSSVQQHMYEYVRGAGVKSLAYNTRRSRFGI